MRHFILSTLLGLMAVTLAADDLAALKKYPLAQAGGQIIYSNTFDAADALPARHAGHYQWQKTCGTNGTGGVVYTRTNPAEFHTLHFPMREISPQYTYVAEVQVRGENIRNHGKDPFIGALCVEYYRNGKWASGAYYRLKKLGADWQKLTLPVTVKPDCEMRLNLYLRRQYTGKLYFDDLTLRTAGSSDSIVLNSPKQLTLTPQNRTLEFSTAPGMKTTLPLLISVTNAGQTQDFLLTGQQHRYRVTLPALRPGAVQVTAQAVDTAQRQILWRETFQLQYRTDIATPAVRLDEFNRLVVEGKLFMPLGIYGLSDDADLQIIQQAGFNALVLYNSMHLTGNRPSGNRLNDIRAGLDRIHAHNLKLMFSLKDQYAHKKGAVRKLGTLTDPQQIAVQVVQNVKNHPAILGWYINDEEPRALLHKVKNLREIVSAADPQHPTWSLTYRNGDFPYYGISGDIMGVDQYMVSAQKPIVNMHNVVEALRQANTTQQPVWLVPQCFNWGVYENKTPQEFAKCRFPTSDEILTNALIGVIHGAKGFFFYSYFDMKVRAEKLQPGSFKREWPHVVAVVQQLKKLEPYIMSSKAIQLLPVQQQGPGEVLAAVLTADNGKQVLLVLAAHDQARGQVTLPEHFQTALPGGQFAPGKIRSLIVER